MFTELTALLVLAFAPQSGTSGAFDVLVEEVSGDMLCSIRARNASIHEVVADVAAQAGLELTGFDLARTQFLVTARLDSRPIDQALHYVLGSAGFRAEVTSRSVIVRPELPPFAEQADLLDAASLAYSRMLAFHPGAQSGDKAELALARIHERLGHPALARSHYEVLIDSYPGSPLLQTALYESAAILKREREWEEAALKYRALVELEREDLSFRDVLRDNPYAVEARLELARCSAHLGNHEHAIYALNDLDNLAPPTSPDERGRRNIVRARALIGKRDYVEALRLLHRSDTRFASGDHEGERVGLVAQALQLGGRLADASLAWLEYSQSATGATQADALKRAAELAIEAGDELGALMICAQGESQGHGKELAALENRARADLDFVERDLIRVGLEQRLARGEELVAQGQMHAAWVELYRAADQTGLMSSEELARFTLAYAAALESEKGLDEAVRFLRRALPLQTDVEHRRAAYRLAADLFEKNEQFDRAIDALGGKL